MEQHRHDAFSDVLDTLDDSIAAFVAGSPEAFLTLWSQSEEVTLAGGRGGPVESGQAAVRARLARVSAAYAATPYATGFTTERIHVCAGHDVAYVVQHERFRFTPTGASALSAAEPPPEQVYRATMTFRHEDGAWRVTHRHADAVLEERTT